MSTKSRLAGWLNKSEMYTKAMEDVSKQVGKFTERLSQDATPFLEGGYAALGMEEGMRKLARLKVAYDLGRFNTQQELNGQSFWRVFGRNAVQGAALGALAGGSISYLQGGDFWNGAMKGAFWGAGTLPVYNALRRATGAGLLPFGKNGLIKKGFALWDITSVNPQYGKAAAKAIGQPRLGQWVESVTTKAPK